MSHSTVGYSPPFSMIMGRLDPTAQFVFKIEMVSWPNFHSVVLLVMYGSC